MDKLYFFVTAVTAFFALLVVICVLVFAINDRYWMGDQVSAPIPSIPLELAWSVVPVLTSMAIFGWTTVVFVDLVRTPDQTLEIHSNSQQCNDGQTDFTRLTIRGRNHRLPLHVAGEAKDEHLQVPCPRDLQLLAATQP